MLYRQEAPGFQLPTFVLLQHSKTLSAEECDISGRLFQITGKQRQACVLLSGYSLEENASATDLEVLMLLTSQRILPRVG